MDEENLKGQKTSGSLPNHLTELIQNVDGDKGSFVIITSSMHYNGT
jgi:hypothetical protein